MWAGCYDNRNPGPVTKEKKTIASRGEAKSIKITRGLMRQLEGNTINFLQAEPEVEQLLPSPFPTLLGHQTVLKPARSKREPVGQ